MKDRKGMVRLILRDVLSFSEFGSGVKLRAYQQEPALAIVDSVFKKKGLTFVVIFPRQSGKNELQAAIEVFLLQSLFNMNAEIVKVSPTWKPQSQNAMRRFERIVKRNLVARYMWAKESGYIYRVDTARIYFLSASPTANVVGATASTLLECDEAQDVLISKWDKEIAPMAASSNATRVFWGTAWTSNTLLAREKRAALAAEKQDGIRRVFELTADQVRAEAPAYGVFVDGEIARHGRNNPYIRTQYFGEEIDDQTGMFTAERLGLLQGSHPAQLAPQPGRAYAFCLDVGGEEFAAVGSAPALLTAQPAPTPSVIARDEAISAPHDPSALTIYDIDLTQPASETGRNCGPTYRIVYRQQWQAESHARLYQQLAALIEQWQPYRVVIDATGVGEGLASMLLNAYKNRIIPFKFSQSSKSRLGWSFIGAIETGRIKDFHPSSTPPALTSSHQTLLQNLFREQARRVQMEILPGPGKLCRWSVPAGARSLLNGEPLHDDLVLSAALICELFEQSWGATESAVIQSYDPLSEMEF